MSRLLQCAKEGLSLMAYLLAYLLACPYWLTYWLEVHRHLSAPRARASSLRGFPLPCSLRSCGRCFMHLKEVRFANRSGIDFREPLRAMPQPTSLHFCDRSGARCEIDSPGATDAQRYAKSKRPAEAGHTIRKAMNRVPRQRARLYWHAAFRASALSVFSQVNSGSSRPKWP